MSNPQYVRFDWAAKNILRNKADYVVFEGLISVLVKEKVTIVELLESESNQESASDKYNRVDIKAKNSKGEIILVEIQQTREADYLQRMLYGVAKAITEHMSSGVAYEEVKKVFSINILYFNMGEGTDYLYHGQAKLIGVHDGDELSLTEHEREELKVVDPRKVFPEYYVIRVNEFDKLAADPLEEWMRYLKDEYISPDTKAPGLKEARERLEYLRMTPEQRRAYDHYVDTQVRDADVYRVQMLELKLVREKIREAQLAYEKIREAQHAYEKAQAEARAEYMAEGRAEGIEKGRAEGIEEGRTERDYEIAKSMKADKLPIELIMKHTGLSAEEIVSLED